MLVVAVVEMVLAVAPVLAAQAVAVLGVLEIHQTQPMELQILAEVVAVVLAVLLLLADQACLFFLSQQQITQVQLLEAQL
jgi:hypothetical protein